MSYKPGTKLSYANGSESCTVLTEGNALITKVWGDPWWEQMRLADWLILAEGKEEEDFIPISKEEQDYDEYADMPPLVSLSQYEVNQFWHDLGQRSLDLEAQRRPVASYPKRAIGTKLKWLSNEDDETYRIAVVTRDGICQVKSITEGGGDCYFVGNKRYLTKHLFENEHSWRQSLPDGGIVVVY